MMNTLAAGAGHRNGRWGRLALAILPVAAVSVLGSWATLPNIPTWYAGLAKPPMTPPNGVFGPVWTLLYALMAFGVWRVLSAHPAMPGRGRALALFYIQLALNGLWSWSFFAANSPAAGLVNILALDAAALATIVASRASTGSRPGASLRTWPGSASRPT